MYIPPTNVEKRISKSTLSMFLRTRCDKELYLSLHDKDTMESAGLPKPVKRPGIGTLSQEGKLFEVDRNDQLIRLFQNIVQYQKNGNSYDDIDLETHLLEIEEVPVIILQGKFSIADMAQQILINIGLGEEDINFIPNISDFIPDIIIARNPHAEDKIIQPDGSCYTLYDVDADNRFALEIFDVKHTSEANPSYCAEIAMYALMLANWLTLHPQLGSQFYVTTNAFLWTRFKQGESELDRLESENSFTINQLLEALRTDSENANLRFYLSSVRRFFEDVIRVIQIGDANSNGWVDLEWHVSSTCSSCDWLGDGRHLSVADREVVTNNPCAYCMPMAKMIGHLSLVPGITRGAKRVLENYNLSTANELANATGHEALQQHTLLKREAKNLPARTNAILSEKLSNDPHTAIASLVKSANLLLYVGVNFDPSSGLLTGLSLSGVATAFVAGQSPKRFRATPYVVDQKTIEAEWVALEGFLSQIAACIEATETITGCKEPKGQIHFWEKRQFEELCNAIGRHLSRVFNLIERKAKALAWIFSPDELIARPESLEASTIVVVEEIVRRMVFTPTSHVITLFDTAEHYHSLSGFAQTVNDPYYREYLSNGIPRERIYEIWSNTSQIKRGSTTIPRNNIIHDFSNALEKQSKALESICERLRQDYSNQFKARATKIPLSIPVGTRNIAFDAKLWVWWDKLNFNMSQLEAHLRLSLEGERLEATYEAIILSNGEYVDEGLYDFDVAQSSTEAKFKEDSRLTIGRLGQPGMPLERVSSLLPPSPPPYPSNEDSSDKNAANSIFMQPLWSALEAKIVDFDRVNARIRVRFTNNFEPQFGPYFMKNSSVDLLTDIFLLENKNPKSFDWSISSTEILKEIGNPSIAVADSNAAAAMGIKVPSRKGNDPITPAANVLWNAVSLEQQSVAQNTEVQSITSYAAEFSDLNTSQSAAVKHSAERALTIIWGPPGTGKTKTLAAFLHGLNRETTLQGKNLKVLVTGPTYKAVEEIMHRTAKLLSNDADTSGKIYMGYSRSRVLGPLPDCDLKSHISYTRVSIDHSDNSFQECIEDLSTDSGFIIVGCQVRQARRFSQAVTGSLIQPLFDVVIIDESSQVPVSHALSALCGLKEDSRLVIAGDHLQMPPITTIEPPCDATYLVGSIQTYLLERHSISNDCVSTLTTNYRSNNHIVEFARSIGYPQELKSYFSDSVLHFLSPLSSQENYPVNLPWCDNYSDILLKEHKTLTVLHEDNSSSQGNHFEARMVAGITWMLRQSVSEHLEGRGEVIHNSPSPKRFWSECIGIVTPHRAQRALVIRELEQLFPGEQNYIDGAVDTVERFQGGERHTIVVSFGVADIDIISGEEAFLMQLERTNVAISRAMAKCIVVMPQSLANHIPEDKKALETAFALKNYIDEFCNIRVLTTFSDDSQSRNAEVRFHQ